MTQWGSAEVVWDDEGGYSHSSTLFSLKPGGGDRVYGGYGGAMAPSGGYRMPMMVVDPVRHDREPHDLHARPNVEFMDWLDPHVYLQDFQKGEYERERMATAREFGSLHSGLIPPGCNGEELRARAVAQQEAARRSTPMSGLERALRSSQMRAVADEARRLLDSPGFVLYRDTRDAWVVADAIRAGGPSAGGLGDDVLEVPGPGQGVELARPASYTGRITELSAKGPGDADDGFE